MEVGEPVGTIVTFLLDEELCKKNDEPDQVGKCRIGRKGSPGELPTPTAEQLNVNMRSGESDAEIPAEPKPKKGKYWDMDRCNPSAFPYQSHHLIPKMHLPTHDVCEWLAVKRPGKEWALTKSTDYDTDHFKNGLALPFASNTHQWKTTKSPARKTEICNEMMSRTGKQLHQGSHTYTEYDRGEQDSLHEKEAQSYLGAVDDLLTMISAACVTHVEKCTYCKKGDTKPRKVRPLTRVVEAMYEVSAILKTQIADRDIFVSERAAQYRPPRATD